MRYLTNLAPQKKKGKKEETSRKRKLIHKRTLISHLIPKNNLVPSNDTNILAKARKTHPNVERKNDLPNKMKKKDDS